MALVRDAARAALREAIKWARFRISGKAPVSELPVAEPSDQLVVLYLELTATLRSQISAQLDSANGNDLICIGSIAATLALAAAMLVLRATQPASICYWWWYPLPLYAIPTIVLTIPLLPSEARKWDAGPHIPSILKELHKNPQALTATLRDIIVSLQEDWSHNDSQLKREQRCIQWGIASLGVATIVSLGLYAWGLN